MQAACLWLKYTSLPIIPSSLQRYAPVLLNLLHAGFSVSRMLCYKMRFAFQLFHLPYSTCEASTRRTCRGLRNVLGSFRRQAAVGLPGIPQA